MLASIAFCSRLDTSHIVSRNVCVEIPAVVCVYMWMLCACVTTPRSPMQDVDISIDPANSCALFITIHNRSSKQKKPALSGKFQFEDYIRCLAAKQALQRSRDKLRLAKMTRIAKILHLPISDAQPSSLAIPSSSQLDNNALISLTPTPEEVPIVTMSAAHRAFMPSAAPQPVTHSSDIEMSNLRVSTLVQPEDESVLDSSIRLTTPTSEIELDPTTLEVRFRRDLSTSRSPSAEVEVLESSEPEDSIQTTSESEEAIAMGYSVTKLKKESTKREKEQEEEVKHTIDHGHVTIVVSDESAEVQVSMEPSEDGGPLPTAPHQEADETVNTDVTRDPPSGDHSDGCNEQVASNSTDSSCTETDTPVPVSGDVAPTSSTKAASGDAPCITDSTDSSSKDTSTAHSEDNATDTINTDSHLVSGGDVHLLPDSGCDETSDIHTEDSNATAGTADTINTLDTVNGDAPTSSTKTASVDDPLTNHSLDTAISDLDLL